jgi:glutamate-1-semialdehyde 2,1-aminomutase
MTNTISMGLADRARRVIPGGVNSGQRRIHGLDDLVIVAASGATFTTEAGKQYIDFHSSFGPQILGHCDPEVDAKFIAAQRRVDLAGVGVTDLEVELAEELVDAVESVDRILLTTTGSEATFHALRVARAVTGRKKIIKFQGCYHGWHDAVALNVISSAERVDGVDPLSTGMMAETVEATIVLPFNDLAAVRATMDEHDVAAVIIEPIPHNIGTVLPQNGFLEGLRELCTSHGAVLVFDEVVTGFRHAVGGYQSICGVRPDLTTFGKAMANGYPIGALGGRADLMDEFSTTPGHAVFFAGTYNGHPGCVAAALETIRRLRREPVHEHVFTLGEAARAGLREIYRQRDEPVVVAGFGSVFLTYFMEGPIVEYRDLLRNDVERFVDVRCAEMSHGVFELPLNLKRSCVSYAHTASDVDRLLEATAHATQRVSAVQAPGQSARIPD